MMIAVNGRALQRPVTGVERVAWQLAAHAGSVFPGGRLLVPGSRTVWPVVDGSRTEVIGAAQGHAWEQLALPRALRKDELLLCPANTGPLLVSRQVVMVHDLAILEHPEWFDRRMAAGYRLLLPLLVRRARGTLAVSNTVRQAMMERWQLPPERVAVVHPHVRVEGASAEPPASPRILLVASNDPRKGTAIALAAFRKLHARRPGATLLVAGRHVRSFPGMHRQVGPGVEWVDSPDDRQLEVLYRSARVVIAPTLQEGFGLTLLEAMAQGRPVVASDLPVFRELFAGVPTYFPPGDTDALADVLAGLIDDTGRLRASGEAGLQQAAAFTPARSRQQFMEAIASWS